MRGVRNRTDFQRLRVVTVVFLSFGLLLFSLIELCLAEDTERRVGSEERLRRINLDGNRSLVRKLLNSEGEEAVWNRIGAECSKDDIVIFQGPTIPLPNGIPTYTVQILNVCVLGCSISNIHVTCGWFGSARMINPNVFKRVCYDDCVVNNGDALGPGETLSFQYANSFRYPLTVSSVSCY